MFLQGWCLQVPPMPDTCNDLGMGRQSGAALQHDANRTYPDLQWIT